MTKLRQPALIIFLALAGLTCPRASPAIETAPRISDREIIESLAELKAGQKALQQQIDQLRQEIDQRFEGVNQRFDDMNRRFDSRFDDMNRRFDDMNRRFDDLITLIQILIGTLVLVLGGMLAWLITIWRRLVRVEAQDDEIKFLKEGFNRLHEMVTQLLTRLP